MNHQPVIIERVYDAPHRKVRRAVADRYYRSRQPQLCDYARLAVGHGQSGVAVVAQILTRRIELDGYGVQVGLGNAEA